MGIKLTQGEAENLRRLFARVGNKAEFARQHGIKGGASMLAQHLSGNRPISNDAALKYAMAFGVPVSEISAQFADQVDKAAKLTAHSGNMEDPVGIRRVKVSFSNGSGSTVYYEDESPPLMFRREFLRKLGVAPGDAVVVDADGISNHPTIVDGSVVLVNRGDRDQLDGRFFAFRFDGELLIKRLERIDGVGILATAENPDFKPKTKVYRDRQLDDFEVIGRACWTASSL